VSILQTTVLQTIRDMTANGYDAESILATIRSMCEAEERREDAYQTEAESRRRLAVLARFGETRDPFGEVA
jgi:hypothetical protein